MTSIEPRTARLYRYFRKVEVETADLEKALDGVKTCLEGLSLEHVMGSLAWHDRYWEWDPGNGGLPGAFWVTRDEFFAAHRRDLVLQAVFFGPQTQVRLLRRPGHFHLALLQEIPLNGDPKDGWQVYSKTQEILAAGPYTVFLAGEKDADRKKRFAYAHRMQAFAGEFKNFLRFDKNCEDKSALKVAEYWDQGCIIDWRLTYDPADRNGG